VPNLDALTLSLTGRASHTIVREPGVGSLTIGPPSRRGPSPDITVGADDKINWSAFDSLTVPAGYPWPRWLYYHGNDTGFAAWSMKRPIERFDWTPASAASIDASRARIGQFTVNVRTAPVDIVLPESLDDCRDFAAAGDLSLLSPALSAAAGLPPNLTFAPDTHPSRDAEPVRLPHFAALAGARSVAVSVVPLRQPFDCASLRQFPQARRVDLRGQFAGPAALASLTELTCLELRYCPDLSGLPPLSTWPKLTRIIGWNIEEAAGKRLRAEIRHLTKAAGRSWEHASMTQLRASEWFVTEYGLPFSGWPTKVARAAVKAYRTAEAGIAAPESPAAVEAAIRTFVRAINALPGIETGERDDAGEAVRQLAANAPFEIAPDLAQSWFDAERHF